MHQKYWRLGRNSSHSLVVPYKLYTHSLVVPYKLYTASFCGVLFVIGRDCLLLRPIEVFLLEHSLVLPLVDSKVPAWRHKVRQVWVPRYVANTSTMPVQTLDNFACEDVIDNDAARRASSVNIPLSCGKLRREAAAYQSLQDCMAAIRHHTAVWLVALRPLFANTLGHFLPSIIPGIVSERLFIFLYVRWGGELSNIPQLYRLIFTVWNEVSAISSGVQISNAVSKP